jgi:hypothetical protein
MEAYYTLMIAGRAVLVRVVEAQPTTAFRP